MQCSRDLHDSGLSSPLRDLLYRSDLDRVYTLKTLASPPIRLLISQTVSMLCKTTCNMVLAKRLICIPPVKGIPSKIRRALRTASTRPFTFSLTSCNHLQ